MFEAEEEDLDLGSEVLHDLGRPPGVTALFGVDQLVRWLAPPHEPIRVVSVHVHITVRTHGHVFQLLVHMTLHQARRVRHQAVCAVEHRLEQNRVLQQAFSFDPSFHENLFQIGKRNRQQKIIDPSTNQSMMGQIYIDGLFAGA